MDFDHSQDTVVSQADISLGGEVDDEGIPMEFEHIEEQPILMDTGNEEIIGKLLSSFSRVFKVILISNTIWISTLVLHMLRGNIYVLQHEVC